MTPRLQTSYAEPWYGMPCSTSGAAYAALPQYVRLSCSGFCGRENPKSDNFTLLSTSNRTFSHFKSLHNHSWRFHSCITNTSKLLHVPRTNLRFGSRSFCASAPTLWNSLPRSVRFCESPATFRKHLNTFYFQSAFPGVP